MGDRDRETLNRAGAGAECRSWSGASAWPKYQVEVGSRSGAGTGAEAGTWNRIGIWAEEVEISGRELDFQMWPALGEGLRLGLGSGLGLEVRLELGSRLKLTTELGLGLV